jgi:hypothetical protein
LDLPIDRFLALADALSCLIAILILLIVLRQGKHVEQASAELLAASRELRTVLHDLSTAAGRLDHTMQRMYEVQQVLAKVLEIKFRDG